MTKIISLIAPSGIRAVSTFTVTGVFSSVVGFLRMTVQGFGAGSPAEPADVIIAAMSGFWTGINPIASRNGLPAKSFRFCPVIFSAFALTRRIIPALSVVITPSDRRSNIDPAMRSKARDFW